MFTKFVMTITIGVILMKTPYQSRLWPWEQCFTRARVKVGVSNIPSQGTKLLLPHKICNSVFTSPPNLFLWYNRLRHPNYQVLNFLFQDKNLSFISVQTLLVLVYIVFMERCINFHFLVLSLLHIHPLNLYTLIGSCTS